MSRPMISVVTVVRNGAAHLEQCLRSVLGQQHIALDYIVIDGGSTDGTLDIIKRHASRLQYWTSEPDSGIAQAMNKGIAKARGDWVLFLQSDDYLSEATALARAVDRLAPGDRLGCFSIDLMDAAGGLRRQTPRGFIWWLNLKTTFTHQGTLFHRELFERFGGYDESYRVDMDYEYYLRLYRAGVTAAVHPDLQVSVMRLGGLSSQTDWPHLQRRFAEERAVHLRHAPSTLALWAYRVYWAFYLPYRRLRAALAPRRS